MARARGGGYDTFVGVAYLFVLVLALTFFEVSAAAVFVAGGLLFLSPGMHRKSDLRFKELKGDAFDAVTFKSDMHLYQVILSILINTTTTARLYSMCVFFTLNRYFYPSTQYTHHASIYEMY